MTSTADGGERYATRMLVAVSLGWAVLQTGRFLLSPLLPAIIADLGITEATAGVVATDATYAHAFGGLVVCLLVAAALLLRG